MEPAQLWQYKIVSAGIVGDFCNSCWIRHMFCEGPDVKEVDSIKEKIDEYSSYLSAS